MKKIIVAFLSFIVGINLYGQDIEIGDCQIISLCNGTDVFRSAKDTYLNGSCRIVGTGFVGLFKIGQNAYVTGEFKDGLLDGSLKLFVDGVLSADQHYVKGIPDGEQIIYYKDGKTIARKSEIKDGVLCGHLIEYSEKGKILRECDYANAMRNGTEKIYDESGKLVSETKYINDYPYGEVTENHSGYTVTYVKNGQGKYIGKYKEQYIDGTLKESGMYDDAGEKTGKWIRQNKNGTLVEEETYIKGKLEGERKRYSDAGKLTTIAHYANGSKDGLYQEYDSASGKLKKETLYICGTPESYKYFYDDGTSVNEEGYYENGTRMYEKKYFRNGKLRSIKLVNEKTGNWDTVEEYDSDGKQIISPEK